MFTNLPFTLPDWMPGWVLLLLALPVLLYLLAFLLMPFSVFGVKARIEALEAQIDSLHDELRTMALRSTGVLPPAADLDSYDEVPNFGRLKKSQRVVNEPAPAPRIAPAPPAKTVSAPPARTAPVESAPAWDRPVRRKEPRLD
jgi:hypothetical protein